MICQIRPGKRVKKDASYFSLHSHLTQSPLIPKPLWTVNRFNGIPQLIRCHVTCLNVIWCYAIIFQSILKPLSVKYEAHLGNIEDVWQHALACLRSLSSRKQDTVLPVTVEEQWTRHPPSQITTTWALIYGSITLSLIINRCFSSVTVHYLQGYSSCTNLRLNSLVKGMTVIRTDRLWSWWAIRSY